MKTLAEKLGHIVIPMVTPFDKNRDSVNYNEAEKLVDHLVEKKLCDSILVTGTTGEFNTMTVEERVEMYKVVKNAADGRVPLLAGTGAASLAEVIKLIKEVEKVGGYVAAMVVAPYYNKALQEGIYRFFEAVVKSAEIDIMLYNIPIFTGINVDPATVSRLAKFKNVKGIKDEAGINPTQVTEYARVTPDDFSIYNGDDLMTMCGLVQGAAGVISGGSHLVGDKMRMMIDYFLDGQNGKSLKIHNDLDPFFRALVPNGRLNPIPVLKAALEITGHPVGAPRLPLCEATVEERKEIREHLIRLGVI